MTKTDKLIERLKTIPTDFTWDELKKILNRYGYLEIPQKGKTGGSGRKFVSIDGRLLILHASHPDKVVKVYIVKRVVNLLKLEEAR